MKNYLKYLLIAVLSIVLAVITSYDGLDGFTTLFLVTMLISLIISYIIYKKEKNDNKNTTQETLDLSKVPMDESSKRD